MLRVLLPLLAVACVSFASPAVAGPLGECQSYPIGVEDACDAATPVVDPLWAQLGGSVSCMVNDHPPIGWAACLPGVSVPPESPLRNCHNPTWDQCIDDLLGPVPL